MTLERLPDGSHTFKPPIAPYIPSQDPFGRTAPPGAPVTRPIGPAHFTAPQVVKNHEMQGYEVVAFQVELYESDGTWEQEQPFNVSHANFSENEMVGDGANIMRHPMKTTEAPAVSGAWVDPASTFTNLYRMVWAFFKGKLFATMGIEDTVGSPPVVYGETSATNPVMAKVTTYAPVAQSKNILCMAVITTASTTRLWIGYGVFSGAALGIEAFAAATLASPTQVDASDGHTGAGAIVSGIIQVPNGDILVATQFGDLRVCTNNTAALAALSFANVQTQALGFYPVAVGNVTLSNYSPGALWWCALDDALGLFFAGNNAGDITPRGRLVMSSYDGLQLDPIDFPDLPYISFPTIYRGGVVACDRKSHYWYTGTDMISIDGGSDRPVNSHKTRLCCGHTVVGDKLVRIEAEIDDRFVAATPNDDYNTFARVIEYDPYKKRERPISKRIDLGFGGGSLIVGGAPSLPFSPNTRNIHWFSIWEGLLSTRNQDFGRWWRQYQSKNNSKGFNERSTDAIASGGPAGFEGFDDDVTYTGSTWTHPALQGFEYTPIRAIFPRVESLLAGGPDASVDIAIGGYTGTVSAAEPNVKYPYCDFGDWPSRTWSTALQAVLTSHLGTGVTHKTPNVYPITLEVIARRPIQAGIRL